MTNRSQMFCPDGHGEMVWLGDNEGYVCLQCKYTCQPLPEGDVCGECNGRGGSNDGKAICIVCHGTGKKESEVDCGDCPSMGKCEGTPCDPFPSVEQACPKCGHYHGVLVCPDVIPTPTTGTMEEAIESNFPCIEGCRNIDCTDCSHMKKAISELRSICRDEILLRIQLMREDKIELSSIVMEIINWSKEK